MFFSSIKVYVPLQRECSELSDKVPCYRKVIKGISGILHKKNLNQNFYVK